MRLACALERRGHQSALVEVEIHVEDHRQPQGTAGHEEERCDQADTGYREHVRPESLINVGEAESE